MAIFEELRLPVNVRLITGTDTRAARMLKRRIIADIINVEMPRKYWDIAGQGANVGSGPQDFTFPTQELHGWLVNQGYDTNDVQTIIDGLASFTPSNARFFRRVDGDGDFVAPPGDVDHMYPEGLSFVPPTESTFDPTDLEFVMNNLARLDSSFTLQERQTAALNMRTTLSEYLYAILQTTQYNGVSAIEAMGNRAFGNTDGDAFPEVVDAWGDPIIFQIEMYDEDDSELFIKQDPAVSFPSQNFDVPAEFTSMVDLQTGTDFDDVDLPDGLDTQNIRIRTMSTGGGYQAIFIR